MGEHEKEGQILKWMSEWSQHCGIEFELTKYIHKSQIRVDFQKGTCNCNLNHRLVTAHSLRTN